MNPNQYNSSYNIQGYYNPQQPAEARQANQQGHNMSSRRSPMQVSSNEVYRPSQHYVQAPSAPQAQPRTMPPRSYQSPVFYGQQQQFQPEPPLTLQMPTANTIERLDQARYVEARLEGGLSPIAVAGVAALLTQMDEAVIYPHTPITISVGHGYQATAVTLLNNEWTGCDLTFPFTDNGINNIVGPTTGRYMQQEQPLRMQRAATPTTTPRPKIGRAHV